MRTDDLFQMNILLSTSVPLHKHMEGELLMVLEGELHVTVEGRTTDLARDDIFFINGEELHSLDAPSPDTLIVQCLFAPQFQKGSRYFCSSRENIDAETFHEMRAVIHDLLMEYQAGEDEKGFLQMSLFYRLLHLLETYHRLPVSRVGPEHRAELLCAYVEHHYAENLSLQQLAEQFHFSTAYLSRLFKQKSGENFVNYLNKVRMRHAANELATTENNVTQVALNNGYASVAAFYMYFKRFYGMKPLEYRKLFSQVQVQEFPIDQEAINRRLNQHLNYVRVEKVIRQGTQSTVRANTDKGQPIRQTFSQLINIGEADMFRVPVVQKALRNVRKFLGGKYVRFWNIFPDKVYDGEDWEDFSRLDEILEFLQDLSLTPFIQVGSERMDQAQFFEDGRPGSYRGNLTSIHAFKSPEALLKALKQMVNHIARLFPNDLHIFFELRESDGELEGEPSPQNYFDVFDRFQKLLWEKLPQAKLGGPGKAIRQYLAGSDLHGWTQHGIHPDFIAFSTFPYRNIPGGIKYLADPDYFPKDMDQLHSALAKEDMAQVPVFITEWNAFLTSCNYFNDSRWKACYAAKFFSDSLGRAALFGHSRLIDDLNIERTGGIELYGGRGALSVSGLQKPVYSVLRCLRSMGDELLAKTENCIVTSSTRDRVRILAYNYKHFNYKYYQVSEHDISPQTLKQYLEDLENISIRVELNGLESGLYRIREYSITETRGSIFDEWIRKNCPDMRHGETLLLQASSEPDLIVYEADVKQGRLTLDLALEPLDVISIEVFKEQPLN